MFCETEPYGYFDITLNLVIWCVRQVTANGIIAKGRNYYVPKRDNIKNKVLFRHQIIMICSNLIHFDTRKLDKRCVSSLFYQTFAMYTRVDDSHLNKYFLFFPTYLRLLRVAPVSRYGKMLHGFSFACNLIKKLQNCYPINLRFTLYGV